MKQNRVHRAHFFAVVLDVLGRLRQSDLGEGAGSKLVVGIAGRFQSFEAATASKVALGWAR